MGMSLSKEISNICLDYQRIETYAIDIVRDKFKDVNYEYSYMTISKKYVTLIFVNIENKGQVKAFKVTYEEISSDKNKMIEFKKERKTSDGINANKIELLQEDIECVQMYFKEQKPQVPNEIDGKELSIIGKITEAEEGIHLVLQGGEEVDLSAKGWNAFNG